MEPQMTQVKEPNISGDFVSECNGKEEENLTFAARAKKAAAAVGGGSMVILGIPLIPAPVPIGCVMVAGGMSVLAKEFPAAQRVLDKGTQSLRDFADEKDEQKQNEDDLGLGFEIVDDPENKDISVPPKRGMDRLRTVVREKVIPFVDRNQSEKSVVDMTVEQKVQKVSSTNSSLEIYNMLSS